MQQPPVLYRCPCGLLRMTPQSCGDHGCRRALELPRPSSSRERGGVLAALLLALLSLLLATQAWSSCEPRPAPIEAS